jgi:hypothetical protein
MPKSDLANAPLKIGDVNLMNSRLFGQVDLSPAPLLSKLPDSFANLDANIGGHSSRIDLVEALYLAHALFRDALQAARQPAPTGDDRLDLLADRVSGGRGLPLPEEVRRILMRTYLPQNVVFCLNAWENYD